MKARILIIEDEVNLLRAEIMQNMTKNEAQHQAQQG